MSARSAQPAESALPSVRDFLKLSRQHSLVPVYRTLTADMETPVSAFLRVAGDEPEAFLLESVEGGEHVGRYTFIGIEPYKKIVSRGTAIVVEEGGKRRCFEGDIFAELKRALGGHTPARLSGLPPFTAGAVGFFSYDVFRQIERLPSLAIDELGVPDACLMFFDQVLAFDHVKKEILLIATADLAREKSAARSKGKTATQVAQAAYARAVTRLDRLEKRLARVLPKPVKSRGTKLGALKLTARTPKPAYLKSVLRAKEYIASGDVFQCVLSQRFDCVPGVDAFDIYRALRIVNPSPTCIFCGLGWKARRRRRLERRRRSRSPRLLILLARRRSCWCGCMGGRWSTGPLPGRGRAPPTRWKTARWRPACAPTRRRSPSM
jgi:anthranilate synthase component 1